MLSTGPKQTGQLLDPAQADFRAEIKQLETCDDEELLRKLPQMCVSPEALATMSTAERRREIQKALDRKGGKPDLQSFKQNLMAKMQRIGQEKKQAPAPPAAAIPPLTM